MIIGLSLRAGAAAALWSSPWDEVGVIFATWPVGIPPPLQHRLALTPPLLMLSWPHLHAPSGLIRAARREPQ
eukprot:jgi/Chlat1/6707/Chrsp5S06991